MLQWYHVAITRNGGTLSFYKDGILLGTQVTTRNNTSIGSNNITIGRAAHGLSRWVTELDEIRIYKRALSLAEVSQLYNLETPPTLPDITSQPVADQNATIGGNITFSVDANGTGLTYQWQKQDANGTWVNIGGATASVTQSIQFKLSMPAPTAWPLPMPVAELRIVPIVYLT